MRFNRKWMSLFAVAVIAAVCGVGWYFHQTYFFNPLTFRNNNVVYLPFRWYRNPLQVQVWGQETPSSPPVIYTTFDKNQIQFVLKELENGQVVGRPQFKSTDFSYLHITIRSGSRPDASIVQDAFFVGPDFHVAQIYTEVPGRSFAEYIAVSAALKKWMLSALQHGTPIR